MEKENEQNQTEPDFDYDFDFSQYENDEQEEVVVSKKKLPKISGLRSRYSIGMDSLQRVVWLDAKISKLSIDVGVYTQDINILKKFLSVVSEKFKVVKHIFGTNIHNEIESMKKEIWLYIKKYEHEQIPEQLHNKLEEYRDRIDMFCQFNNIGIETERIFKGQYSKTKRDIVE